MRAPGRPRSLCHPRAGQDPVPIADHPVRRLYAAGDRGEGRSSWRQADGRMNPQIATKWTTDAVRTNPCHTAEYQTQFFRRWNRTPTV